MKVDDGNRARREEAQQRQQRGQNERAKGDKQRFAEVMERRQAPGGHRRGDERGRELREGIEQRRGREGAAKRLERSGRRDGDKGANTEGREATRRPGEQRCEAGGERQAASASVLEDEESRMAEYIPGVDEIAERAGGAGAAGKAESSAYAEPPMMRVARKIVEAVHVGDDAQGRRVVFLDITVPGRGDVRIRLRRDGGGMEVRMRADNDALARSLQQGVADLREEGAEQGIQFTSVQVVR